MVFFCLAGVLGVLVPAAAVFYVAVFALLVFTIWRAGKGAAAAQPGGGEPLRRAGLGPFFRQFAHPGFLLFIGFSLAALLVLAVKQPVFSGWDEFSAWGVSVKLTKFAGTLHTAAPAGWWWTATAPPGLILLGWFPQGLSPTFAAWPVFFGYAMLLFACFSAVLAAASRRRFALWAPAAAVCLFLPFFFGTPERTTFLSTVYMTAYADLAAGILFGGNLAFYFVARQTRKAPAAWAALPLSAFALCKEDLFPVALVAAVLMAADTLFAEKADRFRGWRWRKLYRAAGFLAAPVAVHAVWANYAAAMNALNPVTGGAATSDSPVGAALRFLTELFIPSQRGERFMGTWHDMSSAFLTGYPYKASMFGGGLATALLVLALLALAVWLAPTRAQRRRTALAAGLSTLGFLGHQTFLFIYYAFLSKYASGIPDYNRYSSAYYAGWLLLALALLLLAAREGAAERQSGTAQQTGTARALAAQGGAVALALCMAALFTIKVLPGYSVLDFPQSAYAALKAEEAEAAALAEKVDDGARVFFVKQGDTGEGWFRWHYYFYPHILDYSYGGTTFLPPTHEPGEAAAAYTAKTNLPAEELTPEELAAYLAQHGCNYILAETVDDTFVNAYGALFTDGLATAKNAGAPVLYRQNGGGLFAPVA